MTVILRPLINEKSMGLTRSGFYTFEVDKEATKPQIAKIVAEKFKVTVLTVNTINRAGKTKTQRTRKGYFKQPHLKKAIVKVGKNDKIALFEQISAPAEEEVQVRTAEGEALTTIKEKKSLLKGTKVKIEKQAESVEDDKRKQIRDEEHRGPIKGGKKGK